MALFPFGAVRMAERLGGMSNTTYKVATESKTIALRLYTPDHNTSAHIALELEVLQHLARKQFAAPRQLAGKDGALVQHWREYALTAAEFIDGLTADGVPLTERLCENTGRMLALFQAALRDFVPMTTEQGGNFYVPPGDLLTSLEREIMAKGFAVDGARLLAQWERASRSLRAYENTLQMGLIHADLWPPNVVCNGDEVAGLIDFDDCCFTATIVDFAEALMEFCMSRSAVLNRATASAFVGGYLSAGGSAAALVPERIVEAMELACALWVYWEIIELPALAEGEKCLRRLTLFDDALMRAEFTAGLANIFEGAKALVQID